MAEAKAKTFDNIYKELDTREGQKKIFKIVKACNKATKDFKHIKQIKDDEGNVLRNDKRIIERWRECFEELLNEENSRTVFEDGTPNENMMPLVSRGEAKGCTKQDEEWKGSGTK